MKDGYVYLIEDELINKLEKYKKDINNIGVWHKLFLPIISALIVCFTLTSRAIIPFVILSAVLGITEGYVLSKKRKIKEEIKSLRSRLYEVMEIKEKNMVKKNDMVKRNHKKNNLGCQLDYTFEDVKVDSKPFAKVRRRGERISSRLR